MPIFISPTQLPSTEKWVALILLVIATLLTGAWTWKALADARLKRIGTPATATVKSSELRTRMINRSAGSGSSKHSWKESENYYVTELSFVDQSSQVHTFKVEFSESHEVGATESIVYNADKPDQFELTSRLSSLWMSLFVGLCIFTGVGLMPWGIISVSAKYSSAGSASPPTAKSQNDIQNLVNSGKIVEAIKAVRKTTGKNLKECKEIVDAMQQESKGK